MPIDIEYILYGAIGIGVFFLVEGLFLLIIDQREHSKANRRMNMLAAGMEATEVYSALRRKPVRKIRFLGPIGAPIVAFEDVLSRTGLAISLGKIFLIMLGLTFFALVGLVFVLRNSTLPDDLASNVICVLTAILIGFGVPISVVSVLKNRRMAQFAEQLPDTLDTLVRGLRAGHPVASAMNLVTKEMPDPMGSEFGIVVDEMTYGLELRQALENMAERVRHPDFEYLVVAINIQHETGGNLAEVLSGLAQIIRDRFRMFNKIEALSAEGRMSAWVLSLLPIATLLVLSILAPAYYGRVMNDPIFWPIAGTSVGLLLTGIYMMYRMVNFRV